MTVVLRLLALAALLLMPFGMGLSPAMAAGSAHGASAMMADGHCDGPADQDTDQSKGKPMMGMHCSAACTALPADHLPVKVSAGAVESLLVAQRVAVFSGTIPPPATPPPKLG